MLDRLEQIREARDRRAFNAVALVIVAVSGWLVVLAAVASAVSKAVG